MKALITKLSTKIISQMVQLFIETGTMHPTWGNFFYACCRLITRLFFHLFCRVHCLILEAPPKKGAFIMASNHISHFDPPLLSAFFPRALDWVAMEELLNTSWSKHLFHWLNIIPIDRSGKEISANRRSLRTILARLAQGRAVGIFPEGGIRSGTESILERAPMKSGLSTLSLLSKAPVVPCVILGSDRLYKGKTWFRRPSLWIIIGKAISPIKSASTNNKEAQRHFQEQLNAIFPKLQQELCDHFHLKEDDLPQTAQERRG